MSKNSASARHRVVPARSTVPVGLSSTAKAHALTFGRPALVAVAASGLLFSIGAPAQAGVHGPGDAGTANAQAQTSAAVAAPAATVQAAAAPAPAVANVHTVVSGDTLGQISATNGVPLNDVLAANGLSLTSVIYPGDQIRIPGAGYTAPAPAAKVAAAPASPTNTGIQLASTSAPAAQAPASSLGAAILASANSQLGVQQDCTAMVEKALRSVGKSVGDLAPGQFYQYGSVVGTPAPGDLVITAGHVGVYAGNGQVVSGGVDGYKTEVHSISWLSGVSFVRVA
ncbi:C40 family peptidase [Pseudarthrobacter cellobiosi]|uniref:C40 family peptidase n=1 Tax=Pseudarthrobacter cellobiosi TaxID=2953654 RepID=UPI00208E904D|nr:MULTISPECIES: LysM peptidoglycan-binding domain-containing protein [unclassified Pseudarthrobacter]MCO4257012.1 LysM peptidoglycan-binding domain-containing C40 family peptidase [Pseudarthrobacter sp. HLT1-5]MCO4272977.1 LysM peptidoglycan-binding domain-containing C40 family peptidase [Pseudarthrobacter sp. HLT3-5]